MALSSKLSAIILMTLFFLAPVAGSPTVDITSPTDVSTTTDQYVRVEGTSGGTQGSFNQTTQADFLLGTYTNISINSSGQIELGEPGLGPPVRQNNGNTVLSPDGSGFDSEHTSAGVVLFENNVYRMWYAGSSSGVGQTGYATSTDGVSWSRQANPALAVGTGWEATRTNIAGLVNDSGTLRAVYTGHDNSWNDRIGYATSTDGKSFTKQNGGNPVMAPGAGGKFDDFGVFSGPLLKEGNTYKQFYQGSDGVHFRIGQATSSDCLSWTRQNSGNPVIPLGSSGAWDDWDMSGSFVFRFNGKYHLFYGGDSDTNHNDWQIGYATSDDGLTFTRENGGQPWLTPGQSGKFDEKWVGAPRGVLIGNTLHLWYGGRNNAMINSVGYVKATFGGDNGMFTSPPLDAGGTVNWGTVDFTENVPVGSTLVVKTRSSDDGVGWSTWQSVVNGGDVQSPDNRFIQYQVVMTRSGISTPSLLDIGISYTNPVSKVEVSLDQSTWFPADGTVDDWYLDIQVSEGSNTIYVKATDMGGLFTIESVDIVADFTPPTGTILVNDGDTYTMDPSVTVTLSAGDLSGIDSMMLSIYPEFTEAFWMDFATEEAWTIGGPDGNHSLYVKYRDNSGLESQVYSDSIILDTTPPIGNMSINDGDEYTNSKAVSIDIDATDENGIGGVILSDSQIFTGTYEVMKDTFSWNLDGNDGQKFVWARVKDSAGHTVDLVDEVILDTTAPTLTVSAAGGDPLTGNPIISLAIDAVDENGVDEMMISQEPSFIGVEWEPYKQALAYDLGQADGLKTIYVKVKDLAGNEATEMDTITLNTVPPAGILKINDGDPYSTSIDVLLSIAVDNETEMQSMMVSNDISFVGASWTTFSNTVMWKLDVGDGTKTVHLRLMNIYGISNSNISDQIILDSTPPNVGITEPEKSKVAKKTITLVGEASDENGLSLVEVKIDEGNWTRVTGLENWTYVIENLPVGKHSIIVKATDKAGNEQVTAKEITRRKTSQETPGFGIMAMMLAVAMVYVVFKRRR